MNYTGPMEGFESFLRSDESKRRLYNSVMAKIDDKVKANRGAYISKFKDGGLEGASTTTTKPKSNKATSEQIQAIGQEYLGRDFATGAGGGLEYYKDYTPDQITKMVSGSDEAKKYSKTKRGVPDKPTTPTVEAAKIESDPRQEVKFTPIGDAKTVDAKKVTGAPDVAVTDPREAKTITAKTSAEGTKDVLKDVKAIKGEVSDKAIAQAQTQDATTSAVKNVEAAQLDKARQVEDAPTRKLQAEELIDGPSVKSAEVEQTLDKLKAEQQDLDPMMTTQGQLENLYKDFKPSDPPAWADGAVRKAMAVLNQRGLGASSLAGQAVVQAVMESALPIAQTDAQTTYNLGLANLSNRQQTAILAAQQRATFLGQKFDQEFQTKVTNAAKVSDIANLNFNAETQIALENARLAQSVDLANLTNRQAVVMADAAQIANLEMANLNNRQQTEIQNANAFLQMDMKNFDYAQQTQLFKAQEQIKSLFTDVAAQNSAAQFNASSENQVNQFYDSLANETKRFNVTQQNALKTFNVEQENAIAKFNVSQQNAVEQFNASNGLIVSQANAEWRRNIATIDTAAINQVNQFNAQNAMALTTREYEGLWQEFRDKMTFAFNSGENHLDRNNQYAIASMQKDAQIEAAKLTQKTELAKALGAVTASALSGTNFLGSLFKSLGINKIGPGNSDTGIPERPSWYTGSDAEYEEYLGSQILNPDGTFYEYEGGVQEDFEDVFGVPDEDQVTYIPGADAVEFDPSLDPNESLDSVG